MIEVVDCSWVWKFDEGQGTTAADGTDSHPMTLKGGAGWTDGVEGSALKLDGNGQYADAGARILPTKGSNYSVAA